MSSPNMSLAQRMEAARKKVLQAERQKREAGQPSPQEQAETALQHLVNKLSQPVYIPSHQKTPFGEGRREYSGGLRLSASLLKKLPAYRHLVAEAAALCPRFSVQVTTFTAKLHGKSVRVRQVVVEHPGLTRAQFFGDHSGFSVYEKHLADVFAAARAERLTRLRGDRAGVATFNQKIADWIPRVEAELVRWYAHTGKAEIELTFGQPWYIPYEPERLTRLPAYKALEAAARKLDKRLRVTAEGRSGGMGNADLVIKVAMVRFRRSA